MAKLVAFYSRADENYFGGCYKYVTVGNIEKLAKLIAKKQALIFLRLNKRCLTQQIIIPVLIRHNGIRTRKQDQNF